jgi:hypothetical protein
MTQMAIAEKIERDKAPREIEIEDWGALTQLIADERGDIAVREARFEIKHLGFEIVVAMIVAAMLVAISALLPLA